MNPGTGSAKDNLGMLSEPKAQLLRMLLQERSKEARAITPFARPGGVTEFQCPAAWAQQRLWFIDQLESGSPAYHRAVVVRLIGTLDRSALQRTLDALVERHEILRTCFVTVDGDLQQQISVRSHFDLQWVDLAEHDETQRQVQTRSHVAAEARGSFDLRTGPLIRGRLLRLHSEEHILLITLHHIACDGWSIGVLLREITELYAHEQGCASAPEALPIQYADYAQWQQQWLQGKELEDQLGYWRAQLAGIAPLLELPTDRPRPLMQSYRGGNVPVALDGQLCAKLRAWAQSRQMTLFMILSAAWAVLLSRLSGQEDIAIGTPIANRQHQKLERLIGFFANTLVLRVKPRKHLRLDELLDQVKGMTLGAYDHQDVPFEKVVEALQPQRSLGRNPLFQVMFALQNAPKSDLFLPQVAVTVQDGVDEQAVFDLFLSLEERESGIVGNVNYAADLFDHATVERWLESFVVLLESLPEAAHCRIGDLAILSHAQRRQVVETFNATSVEYPRNKLVHQLFEEQALRTPQVAAVVHGERALNYDDLNARANQLARYLLREYEIRPGQLVGLCVERGLDLVIGVLAILKAGGAYVPLDPGYPTERLRYMSDDAAPRVVLTQETCRKALPAATTALLALDTQAPVIANLGSDNPATTKGDVATQPVYVIYTSGSTGQPKGTVMGHHSMVNLIEWHRRHLPLAPGQRVLQFAALSFDVAFQEIFSTLCDGGTLVVLDEWIRRDAKALTSLLISQRVERLFVPPMMLQSLAEFCRIGGEVPRQLRDVITAGEQLRISPEIADLFAKLPGCRLHNHYGPTESHVVTALTLDGSAHEWPLLPPIGRPIANTQIYILSEQQQPTPVAVAGEIYIGGANVACGYLNRPQLTAARFIADPFADAPTACLYKTGDLGRWRADGLIEYLGRNDDQVKIRGYRIELGEIEAQLTHHQHVRQAAVAVRGEGDGRRLVAYVTPRDATAPIAEMLRNHLRQKLPEHMVPTAFVVLDSLPLTPTGKLDRRALPEPSAAVAGPACEPPQGAIEEAVAQVWQELLHLSRVGRRDNFFDLGGHSLLAARVVMHIARVLEVELPLRAVFERPTVAELSDCILQEIVSEGR